MNRYPGGAFAPELPGGRGGGTLACTDDSLLFQNDALSLSLPLSGLKVERGGTGGRLLYFKHDSLPAIILHTGDATILRESVLAGHAEARRAYGHLQGAKRFNLTVVSLLAAVLLGIPLCLWLGQDALVSLAIRQVPPSWEENMGNLVFEQIKLQTKLVEDPEALRRFHELAAPLLQQYPGLNIRLHIADDPEINAFALPGGHVVFNRGLLEKAASPVEVLGVLSHEIAHVEKRHSLRQIARSLGLYFTLQLLIGDLSGALGLLQDGSQFLLQQSYSRGMEHEADVTGHAALVRAGLPTDGMLAFFDRIQKEESLQLPALLSTHPATDERIRNIQALQGRTPAKYAIDFDFPAFQASLAPPSPQEPPPTPAASDPAEPGIPASESPAATP